MKKLLILVVSSCIFFGCKDKGNPELQQLKNRVDSLESKVNRLKPGLGEFMLSVQIHHNKLWVAGKAQNWELAKFEIDEIKEQFYLAIDIEADRQEVKSIPMIFPVIDSLSQSVNNKDLDGFNRNYLALTNACNSCHKLVHFEFNKVKMPTQPPFTNQE